MPETENQSPRGGERQVVRRSGVFEDVRPMPMSSDYTDADLVTTRAGAEWGDPVDMRGRDEVTLLVTFTKVAGMTSLVIAVQDGHSDGKDASVWFDRHNNWDVEQGSTNVIPTTPCDPALDVSGFTNGVHRICVALRSLAHYIRIKPFAAGTVVGTRCTIEGLRNLYSA